MKYGKKAHMTLNQEKSQSKETTGYDTYDKSSS